MHVDLIQPIMDFVNVWNHPCMTMLIFIYLQYMFYNFNGLPIE